MPTVVKCKECEGMVVPFYGRYKCSICNTTYDPSEIEK